MIYALMSCPTHRYSTSEQQTFYPNRDYFIRAATVRELSRCCLQIYQFPHGRCSVHRQTSLPRPKP